MLTLGDILRIHAQQIREKPAIHFEGRVYSFCDWNLFTNRLIHGLLHLGVTQSDRVCFVGNNCPEIFFFYSGAEKGAYIAVPINPSLSAREIESIVEEVEPRVVFVRKDANFELKKLIDCLENKENIKKIYIIEEELSSVTLSSNGKVEVMTGWFDDEDGGEPPLQPVEEDAILYLFFTSGSTGKPKGVMLSHKSQVLDVQKRLIECPLTRSSVGMTVMPMYHLGGKSSANKFLYRGCTNVLIRKFEANAFAENVAGFQVNTVLLAPVMIKRILDEISEGEASKLSTLQDIEYSSGPIHPLVLEKAIRFFGPVLTQFYGLTESGPSGCVLSKQDHRTGTKSEPNSKIRSCGLPSVGLEVRVVDEHFERVSPNQIGEIVIKSDSIMNGYWRNDIETKAVLRDGWLFSGDLATVDEEGYIYLRGRKKEMIVSGGENISPREVEDVIMEHPWVKDAAVFGLPDEVWGEKVCVAIVLNQEVIHSKENEAIDARIRSFMEDKIAKFKIPKQYYFVEDLPKNTYGKINRQELVRKYRE